MKDIDWGAGYFQLDEVLLLKGHLDSSELDLAHSLHRPENWPVVNVTFKAPGRGKDRHLGQVPRMINYRRDVATLLCRLAALRANASKETL